MELINFELLTHEDHGTGSKVAIRVKSQTAPQWSQQRADMVQHECATFDELQSAIKSLIRELQEIEKQGKKFFEKERKRHRKVIFE